MWETQVPLPSEVTPHIMAYDNAHRALTRLVSSGALFHRRCRRRWLLLLLAAASFVQCTRRSVESVRSVLIAPSIDLGEVCAGSQVVAMIPVENLDSTVHALSSIVTSCGCLTARERSLELLPLANGQIHVQLDTSLLSGMVQKRIAITVDGRNRIESRINIEVLRIVDVVPHVVNFGRILQDDCPERTISITSVDPAQRFRIIGTSSPELALSTVIDSTEPLSAHNVILRLEKSDQAISFHCALTLLLDNPKQHQIQVPLRGEFTNVTRDPPGLLNFGIVQDGEPAVKQIRVRCTDMIDPSTVDGILVESTANESLCGDCVTNVDESDPGKHAFVLRVSLTPKYSAPRFVQGSFSLKSKSEVLRTMSFPFQLFVRAHR